MNLPIDHHQPDQQLPRVGSSRIKRRGVALILVVSFIVLLSALVISFFSRVTSELGGARSYAEGISSKHLADSAVGVVMGQIRAATTIKNGCWASQPGMIRVYGTAGGQASAQAYAFYKLYSSHNLVVSGSDIAQFDPTLNSPSSGAQSEVPMGPGGWQDQPAFFIDLNQPVDVPKATNTTQTEKRYPIFDPSVALIYDSPTARPQVPNWDKKVEGSEIALNATDRARNDAPMPVRWLYVLRDGTLCAPTPLTGPASGNTGLQANWTSVGPSGTTTGVPSKDNPIVGRIGFWTDDDTCKVNVNTAGGHLLPDGVSEEKNLDNAKSSNQTPEQNPAFYAGSFWDTPRAYTTFDRGQNTSDASKFRGGLANSQPIQNEFQRYPGHPMTTSLGLVLQHLLPVGKTGFDSKKLYQMGPRLSYRGHNTDGKYHYGSEGGTKRLEPNIELPISNVTLDPSDPLNDLMKSTPGDLPMLRKAGYTLTPPNPTDITATTDSDAYHLLGSVDELYYTALVEKFKPGSTRQKAEDVIKINANSITPKMVDQSRFFLTAHSRSPELNLFGRPRVAIWPVPTPKSEGGLISAKIRNLSDDMIRFCCTVGATINWTSPNINRPGEFIFDREDPYSSTADIARQRNAEVFNYLHDLTSNNNGKIPGWGASFESKYSAGTGGRDQILTEIFDYIRCVNLKDTSRDRAIETKYGKNTASTSQTVKLKLDARFAQRGIIIPTRVKTTGASGFGRFPTITEASIVFYHGGYLYRKKRAKPSDPQNAEDVEYDWTKIPSPASAAANPNQGWIKANDLTGIIVRAFIIFETFNPMQGYGPVTDFNSASNAKENIVYEITSMANFSIRTAKEGFQALNMGTGQNHVWRSSGSTYGGRNFGGTEGFFHTMQDKTSNVANTQPYPWSGGQATAYESTSTLAAPDYSTVRRFTNAYYPFQTPCQKKMDGVHVQIGDTETEDDGVKTDITQQTFDFTGGAMTVTVKYVDLAQNGLPAHNELIQTIQMQWPTGTAWPLPITERDATVRGQAFRQVSGGFDPRTGGGYPWNGDSAPTPDKVSATSNDGGWTASGGHRLYAHLPLRIAWSAMHDHNPNIYYNTTTGQAESGDSKYYGGRYLNILQPGDTIRSMIPGGTNAAGSDPRAIHLQQKLTTSIFAAHPDYNSPNTRRAQTLRFGSGGFYFEPSDTVIFPGQGKEPKTGSLVALGNTRYGGNSGPDLPKKSGNAVVAKRYDGGAADFDTGIGDFPDGPYCGKADEGNVVQVWYDKTKKPGEPGWQNWVEPYFTWVYNAPMDTYFSPNRQIPSPVMFGSLLAPQADWDKAGWKTLLFCPNPTSVDPNIDPTGPNHPGSLNPPDHLFLDLFSMPVVEPYAISEPFSTDGKVNLNYQLMPFGYITRSTALRAALHSLRVTAIPNGLTKVTTTANGSATELCYKTTNQQGVANPENLRYLVDRDETVKGFDGFFDDFKTNKNKGFFKSASQICERFFYPKGQPNKYNAKIVYQANETAIKNWWKTCTVTGDNVREKPYSDLYSRITTKSNTYTVHYRVQSLRQRPYSGNAGGEAAYYRTWDESRDQVLSEYRGHTTIERYLDPVDTRLDSNPNATSSATKINVHKDSLEDAYRFRVIYNKRFSPW
jgi:uncharacterized protein (TIGR02600 family)